MDSLDITSCKSASIGSWPRRLTALASRDRYGGRHTDEELDCVKDVDDEVLEEDVDSWTL